jgi:hypothetical protein
MQAGELQLLLGKNGIIIEVSQGENSGGYPPGSMDNPRWMDPALDVATIGDIYIPQWFTAQMFLAMSK